MIQAGPPSPPPGAPLFFFGLLFRPNGGNAPLNVPPLLSPGINLNPIEGLSASVDNIYIYICGHEFRPVKAILMPSFLSPLQYCYRI